MYPATSYYRNKTESAEKVLEEPFSKKQVAGLVSDIALGILLLSAGTLILLAHTNLNLGPLNLLNNIPLLAAPGFILGGTFFLLSDVATALTLLNSSKQKKVPLPSSSSQEELKLGNQLAEKIQEIHLLQEEKKKLQDEIESLKNPSIPPSNNNEPNVLKDMDNLKNNIDSFTDHAFKEIETLRDLLGKKESELAQALQDHRQLKEELSKVQSEKALDDNQKDDNQKIDTLDKTFEKIEELENTLKTLKEKDGLENDIERAKFMKELELKDKQIVELTAEISKLKNINPPILPLSPPNDIAPPPPPPPLSNIPLPPPQSSSRVNLFNEIKKGDFKLKVINKSLEETEAKQDPKANEQPKEDKAAEDGQKLPEPEKTSKPPVKNIDPANFAALAKQQFELRQQRGSIQIPSKAANTAKQTGAPGPALLPRSNSVSLEDLAFKIKNKKIFHVEGFNQPLDLTKVKELTFSDKAEQKEFNTFVLSLTRTIGKREATVDVKTATENVTKIFSKTKFENSDPHQLSEATKDLEIYVKDLLNSRYKDRVNEFIADPTPQSEPSDPKAEVL